MSSEIDLRDLKAAMGSIQETLQSMQAKQEDDSILLHSLSSKIEIQGTRLRSVEKDLKEVKEILITDSKKQSGVGAKGDETKQSDIFSESRICSLKEDITETLRMNTEKIQHFVRQEIRQVNDLHVQNNNDIISRLDKAEHLVFSPMAEMATTLASIEHLEKGIRTIENSLNDYSQTLSALNKNSISNEELTTLLTTFGKTSEQQCCPGNRVTDDIIVRLDSLTETNRAQTSALENIQENFGTKDEIDIILKKQSWTLLNQIISESQILREIILYQRMMRKTYECDFCINDFSQLINTGKRQYSQVWFIDSAQKYLKGCATFEQDGTLEIRVLFGCSSRILGQKVEDGPSFRLTLKAIKFEGAHWELSTNTVLTNEVNARPFDGWKIIHGVHLATIPCQEFQDEGYIDKFDQLFFRFEFTGL